MLGSGGFELAVPACALVEDTTAYCMRNRYENYGNYYLIEIHVSPETNHKSQAQMGAL